MFLICFPEPLQHLITFNHCFFERKSQIGSAIRVLIDPKWQSRYLQICMTILTGWDFAFCAIFSFHKHPVIIWRLTSVVWVIESITLLWHPWKCRINFVTSTCIHLGILHTIWCPFTALESMHLGWVLVSKRWYGCVIVELWDVLAKFGRVYKYNA